jgi:putative ABC transport system permease protein
VRKVLMGAQFAIALFMVTGTLAVFAQLHWLRTTDMGFRKENLLSITHASAAGRGYAGLGQTAAGEG